MDIIVNRKRENKKMGLLMLRVSLIIWGEGKDLVREKLERIMVMVLI
jgi:hypothetical protein